MPDTATLSAIFDATVQPLTESEDFAAIKRTETGVRCDALHVEEDCYYAAHAEDDGTVWVGWYTPDRWLSESVEADLVHTGDKIDELLEDELVDQGLSVKVKLEHFRNPDKVFVFRGKVQLPSDTNEASTTLVKALLALQACFVELGDMGPDEDE
jgi:hypothetical protein